MRYFYLGKSEIWIGRAVYTDQPNWGVTLGWDRLLHPVGPEGALFRHAGFIRLYYGPSAAHKYCSWWCGDVETPHYRSDDGVLHADSSAWTGRRPWGGPRLDWSWF